MDNLKPLILVTNDDGYRAPGLKAIIRLVQNYGDVLVVAPEKGASGMSHAITISTPLRLDLVKKQDNITIFRANGTPADCVKLAINQLADRKPAVLVSGINHGSNSSISVIYSGTMGGAIEGCLNGIPSIGISLDNHSQHADFSVSEKYSKSIFESVLEKGLPNNTCLNVNFPVCTEDEFKGLKVCRQARGVWQEEYDKRVDPHGGTYYWLTGRYINHENGSPDTDEWAIEHKYASIVPILSDYTNYNALKELETLNYSKYEK